MSRSKGHGQWQREQQPNPAEICLRVFEGFRSCKEILDRLARARLGFQSLMVA
jgi:hypothetical protein